MKNLNRQVLLASRPQGLPTEEVFRFAEAAVAEPAEGEFLVRVHYLAMDPALVSRMRAEANYAESATPGEVMHAYGIGEVVESRDASVPVGQWRFGRFDMQEYCLCNAGQTGFAIDPELAPPSWYLGVLGITGATAYLSFEDICAAKAGETLVISSAGSSVGSVVAQLALEAGCRVVGIVSTDAKAARVQRDFGYDAVVSYRDKSIDQLQADLAAVCPQGVDIYYDNTSGDISEALLDLYNVGARIAVVGRMGISHLADTRLDQGRRDNNVILAMRIRKQGFVIGDHLQRMPEAIAALAAKISDGTLTVREDVLRGIHNVPAAFVRMLKGESDGKQLVQLTNNEEVTT